MRIAISPLAGEHVAHGYTLADLDQMTLAAVKADRLLAMDYSQRWDIAWSEIAETLVTAGEPPARRDLIQAGWRAIYRHVREGLRQRGYQDQREWASGEPTMPRFAQYWSPSVAGSHETQIVERIAVGQVMRVLTPAQREAIVALAAFDDYQLAARALDLNKSTLTVRLSEARRRILACWHEGETPYRTRRTDRRTGSRNKEPAERCGSGHEWTPENTRIRNRKIKGRIKRERVCRECERTHGQSRR